MASAKRAAEEADFVLERDYHVERELGVGGFSVVKEVARRGDELGQATAVKITPLALVKKTMGLDRRGLTRRCEKLKQASDAMLDCPYVVNFLGWAFSEVDYFAFFTLYRGGSLFDRIIASPPDEEQCRACIHSLLIGLSAIHSLGMIHRDIKPENILFPEPTSSWGEPVIADFGIAIDSSERGQMFKGMAGSAGYLSPEMAAGLPYNRATDIWSLGISAYETASGRSPWVSEDPEQLRQELLSRDVPWPKKYWSHISAEGQDCIRCMLLRDPSERWTANELLRHPWFSNCSGSWTPPPTSALRPSFDSMLSQTSTRIGSGASWMDTNSDPEESTSAPLPHLSTRQATRIADDPTPGGGIIETASLLQGHISDDLSRRFSQIQVEGS